MKYKIVLVSFDNNVTFNNQLHLLITACFCFYDKCTRESRVQPVSLWDPSPSPSPPPSLRTDTPDKLRKKAGWRLKGYLFNYNFKWEKNINSPQNKFFNLCNFNPCNISAFGTSLTKYFFKRKKWSQSLLNPSKNIFGTYSFWKFVFFQGRSQIILPNTMQGTRIMLSARVVFDMTRALTIQDPEYKTQF